MRFESIAIALDDEMKIAESTRNSCMEFQSEADFSTTISIIENN